MTIEKSLSILLLSFSLLGSLLGKIYGGQSQNILPMPIIPHSVQEPKEQTTQVKKKCQHFTEEEDAFIVDWVNRQGIIKNWKQCSLDLFNKTKNQRTAKCCYQRWRNFLDPSISQREWTEEEDNIILDLYQKLGAHWDIISKYLTKRTAIGVHNRWKQLVSSANRPTDLILPIGFCDLSDFLEIMTKS